MKLTVLFELLDAWNVRTTKTCNREAALPSRPSTELGVWAGKLATQPGFSNGGKFWQVSSSGLQTNSFQSTLYGYSLFSLLSIICIFHLNSFNLSLHLNYYLFSWPWEKQDKTSPSIPLSIPVFPPAKSLGPALTLSPVRLQWEMRRGGEGRIMGQKFLCEASVAGRQATGYQTTCNLFLRWWLWATATDCCSPQTVYIGTVFCIKALSQRKL